MWKTGEKIYDLQILSDKNIRKINEFYRECQQSNVPCIYIKKKGKRFAVVYDMFSCDRDLKGSAIRELDCIWDRLALHNKEAMAPKGPGIAKVCGQLGYYPSVDQHVLSEYIIKIKTIVNNPCNHISCLPEGWSGLQ